MRNPFFPLSILAYLALLLFGLGSFPLIDWDENIYGAISKGMFQSGEYFRMQVNGQTFGEKPPLFFWIVNGFYKILGISEISTRLPSVLSGLISFFVLVRFGSYLRNRNFGFVWAGIYASSLLPLVLARTAYIDHLFNTLILISVLCFYLYSEREERNFRTRIVWAVGAGFFGSLAVLTKGPLGLGIPILIFVGNRIWERRFRFHFSDALVFAGVCLAVLSFYYLTNFLIYGDKFLVQFFDFQKKLLTQSLESHTGPFYYHFIVAFIGFFPWTVFLFYLPKNIQFFKSKETARISRYFLIWILSVLLIFSVVKTKLPHYSSSIYIGFAFFAALLWEEKKTELAKAFRFIFLGVGLVFGLLFAGLPWILVQAASNFGVSPSDLPEFSAWDSIPGLLLVLGISISFYYLIDDKKKGSENFLISGVFSMLLFIASLSTILVPKVLHFLQDGTLRLFDSASSSGNKIVFYKYLSFYPMFYREDRIHIVGSYKFKDESELFKSTEKLSIICNENSLLELVLSYPDRKFETVSKENTVILLKSESKLGSGPDQR